MARAVARGETRVEVPVGVPACFTPMGFLPDFTGRVNSGPVAGIPDGRLLVHGFRTRLVADGLAREMHREISLVVEHREPGWNLSLAPDGSWREIRDRDGNPAYPPIDFGAIPDPE